MSVEQSTSSFNTPTMLSFVVLLLVTVPKLSKSSVVPTESNDDVTTEYAPLKEFLEAHMKIKHENQENSPPDTYFSRYDDAKNKRGFHRLDDVENLKTRVENLELRLGGDAERPKSWNLLHVSSQNHPYDDRKGWVSLEAVPWSTSKVSKWQSKYKPKPNWLYLGNDRDRYPSKPFHDENADKPSHFGNYGDFPKKTNYPQIDYDGDFGRPHHSHHSTFDKPHKKYPDFDNRNCNKQTGDIVTDGLPPNFPSFSSSPDQFNRRQGFLPTSSEHYPVTYPSEGDGEWVLLSTTRGYKYPKRQRSLNLAGSDSVNSHHSVQLTVLPPLKNSKLNMTKSHGGLLEVESTFQTVDQSQKVYERTRRLKQFKPTAAPVRNQIDTVSKVTSVTKTNGLDTSAVVAALGAGMIPATMAMLVPMAMNGRRRRDLASAWDEFRVK